MTERFVVASFEDLRRLFGESQPTRLIRMSEAAAMLGVSVSRFKLIAQRDRIPHVQHTDGGPWLYQVSDLEAHIARKKRQSGGDSDERGN